jgi:hypothetical protein
VGAIPWQLCGGTSTCTGRWQPVVIRLAQTTFSPSTRTTLRNAAAEFTMGVTQYTAGTVWHYFDPQYTTTFEPWSYQPGDGWAQVAAHGGYPTFDGTFSVDNGFTFKPLTSTRKGSWEGVPSTASTCGAGSARPHACGSPDQHAAGIKRGTRAVASA